MVDRPEKRVRFQSTPSPHVRDKDSVERMMTTVLIALAPAGAAAVWVHGARCLLIILIAVTAAFLTELGFERIFRKPPTIDDKSACVTGILLAFSLPVHAPLWMPALGSLAAVILGKQIFGGLGSNPLNPALVGRIFLMILWPNLFHAYPVDASTAATPLQAFKGAREVLINGANHGAKEIAQATLTLSECYGSSYYSMLVKKVGCLGETSVVCLLLGAGFLLYQRTIGWKIPLFFIGTFSCLSWVFGGAEGLFSGNVLFHLSSGGLILCAFFMATDPVTSPVGVTGRILFGAGCGLLTVVFRLWGPWPEGVAFAVILMNAANYIARRHRLGLKSY
jgi:electron transport complex protein RnfD